MWGAQSIHKISKAWFEFTLNLVQCMLVVCYKSIASDSERYTKELHSEKWLISLPSFFNSCFNMVNTLAEFIELKTYDYTITTVLQVNRDNIDNKCMLLYET